MKRLCSIFLMLIVLPLMSTVAFAASTKTYWLDDLGIAIDISSEYVVFTRDIADNDSNLSAYGLSKNELSDLMESGNIYLNAWDKDVNFEIIVTMSDSRISDFNLIGDTVLNTLASSFEDEYANSGVTVEKHEIYQHDQAKFIKIYINQPNGTDKVYGLQYYTVYDSKAINITMQSYSGKLDSDKEYILKSIVDTVHFNKEPLLVEGSGYTEAFVYIDKNTGSAFTVPANWTQEALTQNREYIDVKFTSNKEPGLSILYSSTDVWAELSSDNKAGISRSEINNTMFTLDEVAETMGVVKNDVSTVKYGGKEYYRYNTRTVYSIYGIDVELTTTCLVRFENGYAYFFQFSGDRTNAYYKDFEALLESVSYPGLENASSSDAFQQSSVVSTLLKLLKIIVIYSVPILIYRYGVVKQPVEKIRAKRIAIIYGVMAFGVMSVLIAETNRRGATGGIIVLWSWVNYKILTGGKKRKVGEQVIEISPMVSGDIASQKIFVETDKNIAVFATPEIKRETQNDFEDTDAVFCYKCGTKLNKNDQFCYKCGEKLYNKEVNQSIDPF